MTAEGSPTPLAQRARTFVIVMGIVAMFGDMTYEGARGIVGPYLALLGASAATVGFAAGLGELLGYGLRLASGWLADRTRAYWPLVVLGYSINLVAVPGLALVGGWRMGIALLVLERVGKAIRSPARSTLVSYASTEVGAGWSFGLDEALDQLGAVTGPLMTALAMWLAGGGDGAAPYRAAFAILILPVFGNLALVAYARAKYPQPEELATRELATPTIARGTLTGALIASSLLAFGFCDWALVAYHAGATHVLDGETIAILYAVVMGIDALAALAFGRLFDRVGLGALALASLVSAGLAPFVFLTTSWQVLVVGAVLWGIGMGAQDSILKAAIAVLVPKASRARAYGLFFAVFGAAWWAGSTTMGWLYDRSMMALVVVSVAAQLAAAVAFLVLARRSMPDAQR
jgi:MFS family permease